MDKRDERVLIIEDEPNLGATLAERLKDAGYDVTWARTRQESETLFKNSRFDLALIDVGLPDGSGFDLARSLRAQAPGTAFVFLTALSRPEDRIEGLELGAEDYIGKPFHLKELLLRVQNVIRRAQLLRALPNPAQGLAIGEALVWFDRMEIEAHGERVSMSQKEASLLRFLFERRGKVTSRSEILDEVWDPDEFPSERTIDNFIVKIRRWIEPDPTKPVHLRSVRGMGYQLYESTL